MQAGKLRHRVKLQELTEAADNTGQLIKNWNTIATVWADITPKGVTEFTKENLAFSTKFYDVKIRWTKSLSETMIIVNKKIRKDTNTNVIFNVAILLINLSKSDNLKSMASNKIDTKTAIKVILVLCLSLIYADKSFNKIIMFYV